MAGAPKRGLNLQGSVLGSTVKSERASDESPVVKWMLVTIAFLFVAIFLLLPLVNVFSQALSRGLSFYKESLLDSDSLSAVRLTLLIAAISVPLNLVFGLAASWAIAKFDFAWKPVLITLIDLPFAISPVVAGLM